MKKVLLLSNSKLSGQKPLEWCRAVLSNHLDGIEKVLFIPWALADYDGYEANLKEAFRPLGIELESIHRFGDPRSAIVDAEALFVGGGNTFRLLNRLQSDGLTELIRERVIDGSLIYTGSSAGSNVACPTIMTTNDMPITEPRSFRAIGLIDFQINPHYLDPAPDSKHQGETREERLIQYLEENDGPVLGLREGSFLRAYGDELVLGGELPARWFERGQTPREIEPGTLLPG